MSKLLVVVDYQNDFVNGSLGFPGAEALEEPICRKIEEYKARGDDVAFTFDTHGEDYLETQEGKNLPVTHCVRGMPGWELYGRVADYCDALTPCFHKPAFGSMALAYYAKTQGYEEVELCGLVSNICVISNAVLVKAALPEARVSVDARCTACADPAMNESAPAVLGGPPVAVTTRKTTTNGAGPHGRPAPFRFI